ncbi:unnamed protein product [Cylindrotheca closterium]|uniref:Mitochondrial splicing suppressor 51-like C-terminal domain-containing protein n=1 Tax=Cylindrotheca closterium TaxID=2856 RepID=A0AAD2JNR2_9STRA|nr:unnamed protein product [Cylindrotheca closterium]
MVRVILIPHDESKDIEAHSITVDNTGSIVASIKQLIHDRDYLETPLLRPRNETAGLYAYFNNPTDAGEEKSQLANVRATRLAMACGLLSLRFFGNVLLVRGFGFRWEDLSLNEIDGATVISPDLRDCIQKEVVSIKHNTNMSSERIAKWLADAAQNNYHDKAALAKVARAMDTEYVDEDDDDDDDDDEIDSDEKGEKDINSDDGGQKVADPSTAANTGESTTEFIAKSPLCLHCRSKLAPILCADCDGAYFCCTEEKNCRKTGWSHSCLCPTWKVYTSHREELSHFPFFGEWQKELTTRPFQTQEKPYAIFLRSSLGIQEDCSSWWTTETYGWGGGESDSAKKVNASLRKSYAEGFHPIQEIPPERQISNEDAQRANLTRNSLGFVNLTSWEDYYLLRGISTKTSPVALLCTFPLTVYYSILKYGEVPVTVARMLKRRLRIHLVGAEKEMNFLDLFKEVIYLLPTDIELELVFVVRQDMLPSNCGKRADGSYSLQIDLAPGLTIFITSGTYGDSLDPKFDCGSGAPDMVLALNAGLYAYESWRSVVTFLYENTGVVGVFSDYNEYSGVNCASMGGSKSRDSLCINPFRQPLAMPVYSMNLPQFSNGFLYAFNKQDLDF